MGSFMFPVHDQREQMLTSPALKKLANDLRSHDAAAAFASTFSQMLPLRVSRILRALDMRDGSAALDAVLSLKVTAAMAGATGMEKQCREIELALKTRSRSAAATAGTGLANVTSSLKCIPGSLNGNPAEGG